MYMNYFLSAILPNGRETTLRFSTHQGYLQFLKDNKEWGIKILKTEQHIHFENGYVEIHVS